MLFVKLVSFEDFTVVVVLVKIVLSLNVVSIGFPVVETMTDEVVGKSRGFFTVVTMSRIIGVVLSSFEMETCDSNGLFVVVVLAAAASVVVIVVVVVDTVKYGLVLTELEGERGVVTFAGVVEGFLVDTLGLLVAVDGRLIAVAGFLVCPVDGFLVVNLVVFLGGNLVGRIILSFTEVGIFVVVEIGFFDVEGLLGTLVVLVTGF